MRPRSIALKEPCERPGWRSELGMARSRTAGPSSTSRRVPEQSCCRVGSSSAASWREMPETASSEPARKSKQACPGRCSTANVDAHQIRLGLGRPWMTERWRARSTLAAADNSGEPSPSTGTMSPAGTSDADVSVNSTRANGPDPTSWRPTRRRQAGRRGSRTGGGRARAAGSGPAESHRAGSGVRRPPSGSGRGHGDLAPRGRRRAGVGGVLQGPDREDDVVGGDRHPSCRVASARRSTVRSCPWRRPTSARRGRARRPAGPCRTRPSNGRATDRGRPAFERSGCDRAWHAEAPSTYGRASAAGVFPPGARTPTTRTRKVGGPGHR